MEFLSWLTSGPSSASLTVGSSPCLTRLNAFTVNCTGSFLFQRGYLRSVHSFALGSGWSPSSPKLFSISTELSRFNSLFISPNSSCVFPLNNCVPPSPTRLRSNVVWKLARYRFSFDKVFLLNSTTHLFVSLGFYRGNVFSSNDTCLDAVTLSWHHKLTPYNPLRAPKQTSRSSWSNNFDRLVTLCRCRYATQPNVLIDELFATSHKSAARGVLNFNTADVRRLCKYTAWYSASPIYLSSRCPSFKTARSLSISSLLICSDWPFDWVAVRGCRRHRRPQSFQWLFNDQTFFRIVVMDALYRRANISLQPCHMPKAQLMIIGIMCYGLSAYIPVSWWRHWWEIEFVPEFGLFEHAADVHVNCRLTGLFDKCTLRRTTCLFSEKTCFTFRRPWFVQKMHPIHPGGNLVGNSLRIRMSHSLVP